MPIARILPSPPHRLSWCAAALALALAGVSMPTHAANPARLYEEALVRFEKKDNKGAIIQLKNALQTDRSQLPVQVLLGRALLADGQVAAAEVALMEAMQLGVDRAEVVLPLAEAVTAQGNQPLILKDARFAVSGLPPAVKLKLLVVRAAAAAEVGDVREALRAIEEARVVDPAAPDSWLAEARVRIRARQFDAALGAADKALALSEQGAEALYVRGQIQHLTGDLNGAWSWYSKAIAADPAHDEARLSRAGLLVDLNKIAEAQSDVDALRKSSPTDPRGAYLGALLAERAGKPELTRKLLKEVTELLDPVPIPYIRYKPQALMLNGLAHYGLGEPVNAKPYLEAYRQIDPTGGAAKLLAQIHLTAGEVQPAIEALESYLRVHAEDAQAQALLSSAHMSQGRTATAISVAQHALKQSDAPALRSALGMGLLRSGHPGDALTELESAYRRDPRQYLAGATLVGLYLQQGQHDKARTIAEALVKSQPENAAFVSLLGNARRGAGDKAGARSAFEAASKLDPTLLGAQIQLARLDAADNRLDAAEKRLTGLLSAQPRNVELQFELATLAQMQGRGDEARRWLEKAVDHSGSRDYKAAVALVDLHLRQGQPDKALDVARATAGKVPGELAPHIALARAQLASGDRRGAQVSLTTATRLANYDAPLQLEIGLLQMIAGNVDGAAYSFDKALSTQPDFLPARAAVVDIEIRRGELVQAKKSADAILAAHPKAAIGHSLLGDVAWARGDVAAAAQAYRRAHRAEPSTGSMLRLQNAMQRDENVRAALDLVETWVKAHPNDRVAQQALAALHMRSGNPAAARSVYEALLKDRRDDPSVLNNLANVLLQLKSPDAVQVAERALAAAPGDTDIIDTLGWTLFHNGQSERALPLLRDARLRRPRDPVVRYHLAAVLAQSGRTSEARVEVTQALADVPRFEGSDDARALLKSLP